MQRPTKQIAGFATNSGKEKPLQAPCRRGFFLQGEGVVQNLNVSVFDGGAIIGFGSFDCFVQQLFHFDAQGINGGGRCLATFFLDVVLDFGLNYEDLF